MDKKKLIDLGERAGWTALQAALGVGIADLSSIPVWWALPIATALSAVKTWAMGHMKAAP